MMVLGLATGRPVVIPREIKCPRCGSVMLQEGEFHLPGTPGHSVHPGGRVEHEFRAGIHVIAMACRKCGYLELYHQEYLQGDQGVIIR